MRGYLAGGPDVYNLSGRERRSDGQAHLVLPLLSSVVMGCAYVQRSHFLLSPCTVLALFNPRTCRVNVVSLYVCVCVCFSLQTSFLTNRDC